jgi:hypothetical protein
MKTLITIIVLTSIFTPLNARGELTPREEVSRIQSDLLTHSEQAFECSMFKTNIQTLLRYRDLLSNYLRKVNQDINIVSNRISKILNAKVRNSVEDKSRLDYLYNIRLDLETKISIIDKALKKN